MNKTNVSLDVNPIYEKIEETVKAIRKHCTIQPEIGVILGSGLGAVADQVTDATSFPFADLPNFHPTTVAGHPGQLIIGYLRSSEGSSQKRVPVAILQGRFHYYEGHTMEEVALPTRVLCALGIHTLVLTNAAGGVNTRFRPADLMLIEDHLNLMGDTPLRGPNLAKLGTRFPDLSEPYNKNCLNIFQKAARELDIHVHTGVYAGLLGPAYETPAEVRMLRVLGADAVGMSTVPESIVANHQGVKVVGLSCVTNLAAGLSPIKLTHQEVLEMSEIGAEKMKRLLTTALPRLANLA